MDNEKLKLAKENYELIKASLNELNIRYDKNDDDLSVSFYFIDKELCNSDFTICVLPNQKLIKITGRMEFDISKDKNNILALAIATGYLNYLYNEGSWDFNYYDNYLGVRLTTNYWDSLLSKDVIKNLMAYGSGMIDDDSRDLMKLNNGCLSIEDFLKKYD